MAFDENKMAAPVTGQQLGLAVNSMRILATRIRGIFSAMDASDSALVKEHLDGIAKLEKELGDLFTDVTGYAP